MYNASQEMKWITKWSLFRVFILILLFIYALNNKLNVSELQWIGFHPEQAQYTAQDFINSNQNRLFEGWYFKVTNKNLQLAIIPGAYHSIKEKEYAFIFVVTSDFSITYRFDINEYKCDSNYSESQFFVNIGKHNKFSRTSLSLQLDPSNIHSINPPRYESIYKNIKIKADLQFENRDSGFPMSLFQLGAMGYYGYIPFLECYHGIFTMNSLVTGKVEIGSNVLYNRNAIGNDNDNAYGNNENEIAHGYLEKDWGTNFPQTWFWIQANNFENDESVSITLALARLPIIGDSVVTKPGFLGGLYINNELIRFSTWTWAGVDVFKIEEDDMYRNITVMISDFWSNKKLIVVATVPNAYKLNGKEAMDLYPHLYVPQSNGEMKATLMEFVNATVWLNFVDEKKEYSFESYGYPATVECHSDDNMEYMLQNFGATQSENTEL